MSGRRVSETALTVERYAIYWMNLNPVRGSELTKLRPAVVVSDNAMNAALETVVVCPMTTRLHPSWPSRVKVDLPEKTGEIAVDQIRTVSRTRTSSPRCTAFSRYPTMTLHSRCNSSLPVNNGCIIMF